MSLKNRLYPHLLPDDIPVWERWLTLHASEYDSFNYDVHVGDGRDPGPDFPDNIRQMAVRLSQRRIDVVAHHPAGVAIFEVTREAGAKAIGQILLYPVLYKLDYPHTAILFSAIICERLQDDIRPAIAAHSIHVYTLPG
jgi:hypothetical protein